MKARPQSVHEKGLPALEVVWEGSCCSSAGSDMGMGAGMDMGRGFVVAVIDLVERVVVSLESD